MATGASKQKVAFVFKQEFTFVKTFLSNENKFQTVKCQVDKMI